MRGTRRSVGRVGVTGDLPYRRGIVATECAVAVSGLAGSAMLLSGTGTPPVAALAPLGLTSWVLPGLWLFATVPAPAAVAAWTTWHRSPHARTAVLVAAATMLVEVTVQVPVVGPDPLQLLFGGIAAALALALAVGPRAGTVLTSA